MIILSFSKSQILKILFFFRRKNSQNRRNNVNDFQKKFIKRRKQRERFSIKRQRSKKNLDRISHDLKR